LFRTATVPKIFFPAGQRNIPLPFRRPSINVTNTSTKATVERAQSEVAAQHQIQVEDNVPVHILTTKGIVTNVISEPGSNMADIGDKMKDGDTIGINGQTQSPLPSASQADTTTIAKAILHCYSDPITKETLYGLNTPLPKFHSWIRHKLRNSAHDPHHPHPSLESCVYTSEIGITLSTRDELRVLWKEERLLSERTELLAVYASDKNLFPMRKRGGFLDLLTMYADRLVGIMEDELDEGDGWLLNWLRREYGEYEVTQLLERNLGGRSEMEQLMVFQHLLNWFRAKFPYYYDRCSSCNSSLREDKNKHPNDTRSTTASITPSQFQNTTFLGYVHPTPVELTGHASRTEIYECHKCTALTRFPRYNSVKSIIDHSRGRCGEYSMLLYRILRSCGHDTRWVVDWSDHVWAEVMVRGRYVHLDPCEASVDTPKLYEGWGKEQVYIIAFWAGMTDGGRRGGSHVKIEDVTQVYTSVGKYGLDKRREEGEEEVHRSIQVVTNYLQRKLYEMLLCRWTNTQSMKGELFGPETYNVTDLRP